MGRVRIVWGSGTGPTALASYDAALAAANVQDYNLVRVSSVLPVDTTVSLARTAPDLGPIGGTLTVVEARATTARSDPRSAENAEDLLTRPTEGTADRRSACVGLGWAQATTGRGIVYEATGTDPESVREEIDAGLRAGAALREFTPTHTDRVVLSADGSTERVETESEDDPPSSDGPRHASTDADRSAPPIPRSQDGASPETGTDRPGETHLTAVVLAVYGESDPIF
jgi:arginine decarboxylase